MSLYLPAAFACHDRAAIARLIAEHPLASLITSDGGELFVSHLPLLLVPDREPHGTLVGHLARANPHWQHFSTGRSLAIFQGPHHYVSPAWYVHPAAAVPTWNYAVVHCHGHPQTVEDQAEVDAILELSVRHFEDHQAQPWSPQLTSQELDALRRAIVAFRIPVQSVEAKFKLSQNRSTADQRRVTDALARSESQEARALAAWMSAKPSSSEA
ncbi:Protease synthase and sporulation protein PAI 2 [Burkholderiales bacterium]|nr:MAG: FMN-binding negative transcriptional regulator [Burkholderiales bacterium]CAG1006545.1 Protease synthase and sporulation protein PAI 2 [Burkholderiales bacterium]